MKKLMWAISILSLVLTTIVLQFMPDSVPMHYNLAGNVDRWGSKYENLLFAAHFEKKAAKAAAEKERAEALSNAKVLKIVGASMAAMFTIMQGFILYSAYMEAQVNASQSHADIGKVSCILAGAVLIILGNYMPKAKKNHIVGVRISWSMYNDTTWMKSNLFGGVATIIAGLLTIVTTVFVRSALAVVLLLVYILAATVITLIYSHKIYRAELSKDSEGSL